ncbi:hypothetical protein JG687_00009159 [Phytophthora cactorum]|uniref:Uncharacterized protein n=1 Tax=Phytophthora cactorum TaxID=29920 RepID=A0A8T1UAH4_9STRA|nr:hypothetical protein JG687_00009159 [Phytophthora cactorum]
MIAVAPCCLLYKSRQRKTQHCLLHSSGWSWMCVVDRWGSLKTVTTCTSKPQDSSIYRAMDGWGTISCTR